MFKEFLRRTGGMSEKDINWQILYYLHKYDTACGYLLGQKGIYVDTVPKSDRLIIRGDHVRITVEPHREWESGQDAIATALDVVEKNISDGKENSSYYFLVSPKGVSFSTALSTLSQTEGRVFHFSASDEGIEAMFLKAFELELTDRNQPSEKEVRDEG